MSCADVNVFFERKRHGIFQKFRSLVQPVAVLLLTAGGSQAQETLAVPSGQQITLYEVLIDESPGELWVRFRFVAPRIAASGGDITYETAAEDMDHLCQSIVLPYLAEYALEPARVVISLGDREVPFGAAVPEATQFFEAYKPDGALCIWEAF